MNNSSCALVVVVVLVIIYHTEIINIFVKSKPAPCALQWNGTTWDKSGECKDVVLPTQATAAPKEAAEDLESTIANSNNALDAGSKPPVEEGFHGGHDPFTPVAANDYNEFVVLGGVDQTVMKSHQKYYNDMKGTVSGPSFLPIADGDVNEVPWTGLRRPENQRIPMRNVIGSVPSALPQQMPGESKYCGFF